MTPILWHIEISHYNEKARWALDYKGIPHIRRTPLPGLHTLRVRMLTRGRYGRLPLLELEGRRIGDSTAIIAALEAHQPEPSLYPAPGPDRERALALEDHFDEHLGEFVRRFVFQHALSDLEATIDAVMPNAGAARKRLLRAGAMIVRPAIRRDYGVTQAGADEALAAIRAAMDRLEQEIQPSGYLVGESFTVADLTAAALFTPLLAPPQRPHAPAPMPAPVQAVRDELEARRGGAWVTEMYARHRPPSVAVRA